MPHEMRVFVIHTQSNEEHRRIHQNLAQLLNPFNSLRVVEYRDWTWADPEERHLPSRLGYLRRDPTVPRSVVRQFEKVEPERVRTEDLARFFAQGNVTLLLDSPKASEGMLYEFETLLPMVRCGQAAGSLGLVAFGEPSENARLFGLAYTGVFHYEESGSDTHDALALFTARLAFIGQQRARRTDSGRQLDVARDIVHLSRGYSSKGIDPSSSVAPEVTANAKAVLRFLVASLDDGQSGASLLADALKDLIEESLALLADCLRCSLLDEEGLALLLQFHESFRVETDYFLQEVMHSPVFSNAVGGRELYPQLSAHAARLLGERQGTTGTAKLLELLRDSRTSRVQTKLLALGHAGRFCRKDASDALAYLIETYHSAQTTVQVKALCIDAALETGSAEALPFFREVLRQEPSDSPLALAALIGLIQRDPQSMGDTVLRFLVDADPDAHLQVASIAWRMDDDRVYRALQEGIAGDTEYMTANILFSKVLAKHVDCPAMLRQCLSSGSEYVVDVACALSREVLASVPLPVPERHELVEKLREQLTGNGSDERRIAVMLSLATQGTDLPDQEIRDYLLAIRIYGDDTLVVPYLVTLMDGGSEWPRDTELDTMLTYSSDPVIFACIYGIGQQRRGSYRKRIESALSDDRLVFSQYDDSAYSRHIGRWLSDVARSTVEILDGHRQPIRMPGYAEILTQSGQ